MADCVLACVRRRIDLQGAGREQHPLVPGSSYQRLVDAPLRHVYPFGSPEGRRNGKQCSC